MKTLLALLAVPLAFTAVPAMANDCTTAAAKQTAAGNEAVVRNMLAYAYEQGEPRETDCRTGGVVAIKPPAPAPKIICVDCPKGQPTTSVA
ncbi:hypothetical protein [Croceicoccus marinus]|uniref:Uncharacterized protein n=1 Tax=Croceicoccus marinus TaxID=450378 RepID=A0A7G6W160_9SPHN|nr:hypothetical protein [Croceicoccus marinus]QNE07725.1 hypothetical protein H4O24_20080 [Croceicoccus marinus]